MNGNATSKKKQSSSEESSDSSDDEKDDSKKTTTAVKRKRETSETDEISSKKAKNNTSLNNGTSSKPNTPKNNVINEPFRRVKSENVHIKKAELRDNSYKEFDTWGNKANKDLIGKLNHGKATVLEGKVTRVVILSVYHGFCRLLHLLLNPSSHLLTIPRLKDPINISCLKPDDQIGSMSFRSIYRKSKYP